MSVSDNWSRISQKSLSLGYLRVSLYQHIFLNTFRSIERRRNDIRDDSKLCKDRRECRHLQNDRNMYIYKHEAIRIPKSENNIGVPLTPQKGSLALTPIQLFKCAAIVLCMHIYRFYIPSLVMLCHSQQN